MKNLKKLLSLLTVLSMVAIMFSAIPVQVSAAAGDVFNVNAVPDGWRFYTSSYVTRGSNGSLFTLGGSTNKGNGLDNYGIMAANGLSTEVVRANTAYRIKFRVETWFTLSALEVNIDTGTALWSRTNSVQRFTDLSSRSSNSSGGGSSKLYTDLTFDVVTPSTITGNQHFVIGIIPQSGNVGSTANLKFSSITITELMTVDVVRSDTNASIGKVYCLPDDDVETLLTKGGFTISGYSMVADIDTIAADTETITVTYTVNPHNVQEIDFSETYGGGSPDWHYIPDGSYSDDGTGVAHVRVSGGAVQHDSSKEKPTGNKIGQHSVTLANSYSNSGLEAGGTYRVTFQLKTFTQWTPLENLGAYIRFGSNIWDGSMIDSAMIELSGEDLAAAVTSFTPASNGAVTFTISLDVTLPESGWSSTTARNIILVVFGGQYWLDNVTISTTAQFDVQDESGNHLGYAYGLLGDKTADIVDGSALIDSDHNYSLSPATISSYNTIITLTQSFKSNVVEKVNFGSEAYGGYANTGSKYYETASGATVTRNDSVMRYNNSNSGNSFGYRSVVIANDRTSALLAPGQQYALKIRIGTWDNNLANLAAQIGFGNQCWVSGDTVSFSNAQIKDSITGYGSSHVSMNGTDKKDLFLLLKFTVPSSISSNENLVLSLYGANKVSVTTYLYSAIIYSASQITVKSYDGTLNATAIGFEGETATEAFDAARNVKVVNLNDTFTAANKTVSAGNYTYIERGDANGNFTVNNVDIEKLRKYIIGTDTEIDAFGANANATTFTDTNIDIIDMVRIKNILLTPASDPLSGIALNKSGYQLAWSYEFNGNSLDTDYFDTQYGMNRNYGDITTVGTGDKKYNRVENGALVLSPSDNYGAGNTLVSDAYTTKSTMRFTYGYMEICAKLAFSRADFPAIWLKSFGEPLYEIDVVETLGSSTTATCNLHYWKDDHDYSADGVSGRDATITDTSAFHKYGFEWYKEGGVSYIAFYVDGVHIKTLSKNNIGYNADFNEEMYLILENLPITAAVYNNIHSWAGAALEATHDDYPMDMLVDYVRLYQTTNNSGNTLTIS